MSTGRQGPSASAIGQTVVHQLEDPQRLARTVIYRIRRWLLNRQRAIIGFFLGIWPFLVMYAFLYLVFATVLWALEGTGNWAQWVYFSVGLLAGVTFSDVYPVNGIGHLVAGIMVLIFVFMLALVITGFGRKAEQVSREESLGLLGTEMHDHYLVLGSDPVALVAARDLVKQRLKVAMLVERPEEVDRLRSMGPPDQLFLTFGPPAEIETLQRLNVVGSRAAIVSMEEDSTSVIVALLVRNLAPHVRVIVSATRPELRGTIRGAGVTFVASPLEMGGRVCASAAFEPDVAMAIDELTTVSVGSNMEEYVLPASGPIVGKPFREAASLISAQTDCILIGYARAPPGGSMKTNIAPAGTDVLNPADALLVVVRPGQHAKLREWLGVGQGR
jgi:Trk K+ transport system NAD-binding subunit